MYGPLIDLDALVGFVILVIYALLTTTRKEMERRKNKGYMVPSHNLLVFYASFWLAVRRLQEPPHSK